MAFFFESFSKGNQRVPVPGASLAGKEYPQDVSLPLSCVIARVDMLDERE
jgi:hypothetical protein